MSTVPSFDFTAFKTAFTDMQEKAKAAYEKSTATFGDYNDFAKGNLDAFVESGKIFTSGMQGFSTDFVAESKSAFETLAGEAKELAAAKSPADFFKLNSEFVKKHFDNAVAYSSKQSEAALKFASDVAAPLSNRVSVAVEKVKAASL